MTSPGEQAKLPLSDAWLERRSLRIKAMACAYEAERLLGGPQKVQAAVKDFISADVGNVAAMGAEWQAVADVAFYYELTNKHHGARVRTIAEDRSNPNGSYQFVVEYFGDDGAKHNDWYTFDPVSDQELLDMHKKLFHIEVKDEPPVAARKKKPARPRRR